MTLLDEHIPNAHQAFVAPVTEHIHVQHPVHKGINLHQQSAATDQRGKSLAGTAAPALPEHQRPGRGTHLADLELQSLEQKRRKQRFAQPENQLGNISLSQQTVWINNYEFFHNYCGGLC